MDRQQRLPASKMPRLSKEQSNEASRLAFDEIFGAVYGEKPKAALKVEKKRVTAETHPHKTDSKTSRLPKEPQMSGKALKKDDFRKTTDKSNTSHQEADNEKKRISVAAQIPKKPLIQVPHKRIGHSQAKDDKSLNDQDRKPTRKFEVAKPVLKAKGREESSTSKLDALKYGDLTKNHQSIKRQQNSVITKKKDVSNDTVNPGKTKSFESKDSIKSTFPKTSISKEDLSDRNKKPIKPDLTRAKSESSQIKPDLTRAKSESSQIKPVNNSIRRPEPEYKQTMPTATSWNIFELFDGTSAQSSLSRKISTPTQATRQFPFNQQARPSKFPEASHVQPKPREQASAETNNRSRTINKLKNDDSGRRDLFQVPSKVVSRLAPVNNKKRGARDISPEPSRTPRQLDSHPPAKKRIVNPVTSSSPNAQNRKRPVTDLSPGLSRVSQHRQYAGRSVIHKNLEEMDERQIKANVSSIIQSFFPRRGGAQRIDYDDEDDDDDIAMEATGSDVFREEAISTKLAKQEDEEQERIDQQRRLLKAKRAKKLGL